MIYVTITWHLTHALTVDCFANFSQASTEELHAVFELEEMLREGAKKTGRNIDAKACGLQYTYARQV